MAKKFLTDVELPRDPTQPLWATPKQYVDNLVAGLVPSSRSVLPGTGLTGGGDLTADRALAVAYGAVAGTAAQGNDARLSDARAPLAHASTHGSGGSDPLTPALIGALPRLTLTSIKTAAYTAAPGEMVRADTTGGAFPITLPAATMGNVVGVKKTITASATLTVQRAGSDTIGEAGATSVTIRLADEVTIFVGNGTNWIIYGNYMPLSSLDGRYIRSDGASNAAGGSLAGFYPNPTIAAGAIGGTEIASAIKDPAATTAGLRTLGTGAAQAAAGNDARLSDARTPTAHVHSALDVTSGVLDIARIPTGTSATTVALGSDSRLSDARTPTAHVHSGADITTGTVGYARLPVGTAASTVAAGDDSRLTNARTPTAHASTHSPGGTDDISGAYEPRTSKGAASGYAGLDANADVPAANLPRVLSPIAASSGAGATLTPNADSGTLVDYTTTANVTVAVPTGTPGNHQPITGVILASTAARTVSFATGIRTSTGITRGPYSVPVGEVCIFLLRYSALITAWTLTAATVSAA